jgi:hypothetical protein
MTNLSIDDRALRKAWLKQKFGSFAYHEDMLQLHAEWLAHIKQSLSRHEQQQQPNTTTQWLRNVAVPNFEKVAKPGQFRREDFKPGQTFGAATWILDYDRDSGLDNTSTWDWMTEAERVRLYEIWGPMSRMAKNILYTVDDVWDRHPEDLYWILDEEFTGPIGWPASWRDDVLGVRGAVIANNTQALRAKGGEPAPKAGQWIALDPSGKQLMLASSDKLPDLRSPYGVTIWQWIGD